MSFKIKQPSLTNKRKTQPITVSAFDQSIMFVVMTKIQKCLYDISKSKLNNLQQSLKAINKDITIISEQCKDRQKVIILETHLQVFNQINNKNYNQSLNIINKKLTQMNQKTTNPILRLSMNLAKSLVLRSLNKQSDSQHVLHNAITELDLSKLKIRSKSLDYKIIQATIICISIIADHFNKFQSHSTQFRQIYAQAYRISHKYLTQYHKLTETLFTISKKFPVKENNNYQLEVFMLSSLSSSSLLLLNSREVNNRKLSTIAMDSNRSAAVVVGKNTKSDRVSSIKSSSRVNTIGMDSSSGDELGVKHNKKKVKPQTKRLKTLDHYINLQESKQKCLSKLYGMQVSQLKHKQKKSIKRPKYSTSLKTQQHQQQTHQINKELQSIYQIYLPKINQKKSYQEKLNAADILKYGSSLEKLKPNYFDKLSNIKNKKQSPIKKGLNTPPIHEKNNNAVVEKNIKIENKTKTTAKETPPPQDIKTNKQQKQQPLPPIKSEQVSPKRDQLGCQLI